MQTGRVAANGVQSLLHVTVRLITHVMPHCHDAQALNAANAHQAAARSGKQCRLHSGMGRQFAGRRSLLKQVHARKQKHDLCKHRSSVTCTAVAEASPEIAERGQSTPHNLLDHKALPLSTILH